MAAHEQFDERRILVRSYINVATKEYAPKNSFDAFFPFIVAAADAADGLLYEPYSIAARLRSFGWTVGGDFVELFTEGLTGRGLLTKKDETGQQRWTAKAAKPDNSEAEEEIGHLKSSFYHFTEKLGSLLLHNMSEDDRLNELAKALATHRLFSIDALQEYAERERATGAAPKLSGNSVNSHDFDYLCARFIQHCHKLDRRSFNALIALSNIGIVTHLAHFFHNRSDQLERTGSPVVILDGPFLIDYMGLNGEVRRADAAIIIDSARSRGSKIWAFRHSISEAKNIVTAVTLSDPRERYGPLAAALRAGGVTLEALDEFRLDPFGVIDRLGIVDQIFDVKARHKWQEEDFRDDDWQAVYARLVDWKDLPRRRDCDSILGVMRLRAGHVTRNPWDTHFFLLTSNPGLAHWAKLACVQQTLIGEKDAGPAISRHEFAAILWLAGDPEHRTEVVSAHLLAAAQGLLARDEGMIEKVKDYTANLEANRKELVDAIVQSELSYEMLQDLTLGNPSRLRDDSFDRVVDMLIERGRLAGAEEAQEKEKLRTRRLREEAETAKLAMEASAKVALDAAAQATQAEQERAREAERAAAAESRSMRAAEEQQRAQDEARKQLVAAQNMRRAIAGRLSGDESDWTRVANRTRAITSISATILLFLLASLLAYFGWLIKTVTGVALVLIGVAGISVFTVLNDTVKARSKDWIKSTSEHWTERRLLGVVRKLEKRLGITQGLIQLKQAEGRVFIANRDEIIEAIERVPTEPA